MTYKVYIYIYIYKCISVYVSVCIYFVYLLIPLIIVLLCMATLCLFYPVPLFFQRFHSCFYFISFFMAWEYGSTMLNYYGKSYDKRPPSFKHLPSINAPPKIRRTHPPPLPQEGFSLEKWWHKPSITTHFPEILL